MTEIIGKSEIEGNTSTKMTKKDHALALAAEDFRVFPLLYNDKKPRIKDWPTFATCDAETVRNWWEQWPDANIGIFTGRYRDGALVVVDIDRKKGNDGLEAIALLELGGDALTETRTHRTASGGAHLLYLAQRALKQGVHVLGLGLDIRSDGGYVVAPGSTIDGERYTVAADTALATVPEWVAAKCGAARPKKKKAASKAPPAVVDQLAAEQRAIRYLIEAEGTTLGAGSNDGTYKVVAKVKDCGVTPEAALSLMLEHWNEKCSPPWPVDKLRTMIDHAYEYGQEEPGVAAPEVVFAEALADDAATRFDGALTWPAAKIREEAAALLELRATDRPSFNTFADMWSMMGEINAANFSQLMDDAELGRASSVDIVGIVECPDRIQEAKIRRALVALKVRAPEVFQRVEARLTTGRTPVVVKPGKFNGAVKAGEKIIRDEMAVANAQANGKQIVRYSGDSLVEVSDQIEQIILSDHAQGRERVFSYGDKYVCLRKRTPATVRQLAGSGYPDQPLVFTYTPAALRERIQRSVSVRSTSRGGESHAGSCPDLVVQTLAARNGGAAPALTGIIEAPTIRPDGSLLDAPGYDVATGLYAWFDHDAFHPLAEEPTQSDAAQALEYLRNRFLAEFCFSTDTDRDVAIAALLTALTRRALPGDAPGFVFSAPQQASGKTALVSAICGAAYGRPASAVAWPHTDDEMGKVLLALLREGQSGIVFDNVADGATLASPALASAMTSPEYNGRMLHTLDAVKMPTNVAWFVTGNNVGVEEDLATRFLMCDMDPRTERPDQRAFTRSDLAEWVSEHRADIVGAALVVARAYAAAGSPNLERKPTRFGAWDRAVRFPLAFAGGCDIGVKFDRAHDNDSGLDALRDLLTAWRSVFGNEEAAASDVLAVMSSLGASTTLPADRYHVTEETVTQLRRAMLALVGVRRQRQVDDRDLSAKAIGDCLKKWARRPVGGYRLDYRRDSHTERNLYHVEALV